MIFLEIREIADNLSPSGGSPIQTLIAAKDSAFWASHPPPEALNFGDPWAARDFPQNPGKSWAT